MLNRSATPKTAIVHEWFTDWAGSERVVEEILACYPHADLFALADFLPVQHRKNILGKPVTTSFLQRLPFARSRLHFYLPLMPIAIEQLDLSDYDLIISSSHAVAKGVITGPYQLHLSYVHSPMRYAWDQQQHYLRGAWGSGVTGVALRATLHYLRMWDVRTAAGVHAFAANSRYVAGRIWKTYRRPSAVIHPPVDVEKFSVGRTKSGFYLCATRLMPYKRVDLIADAFTRMPDRKLVIIGDGPEYKKLRKNAASNVAFLGYQPNDVLIDHLQRATAFVFAAEEDFGILPIEAQACGTPVIAYGRGGARETVRAAYLDNPTGLFFDSQSVPAIIEAVERFEKNAHLFTPEACRANALSFSRERFRKEFTAFVDDQLSSFVANAPDSG